MSPLGLSNYQICSPSLAVTAISMVCVSDCLCVCLMGQSFWLQDTLLSCRQPATTWRGHSLLCKQVQSMHAQQQGCWVQPQPWPRPPPRGQQVGEIGAVQALCQSGLLEEAQLCMMRMKVRYQSLAARSVPLTCPDYIHIQQSSNCNTSPCNTQTCVASIRHFCIFFCKETWCAICSVRKQMHSRPVVCVI